MIFQSYAGQEKLTTVILNFWVSVKFEHEAVGRGVAIKVF